MSVTKRIFKATTREENMSVTKRIFKAIAAFASIAGIVSGLSLAATSPVQAAEKVDIAIISFSPYAPWYIIQEKGMAKGLDINVRIIEDIAAKNAAITSGKVPCMLNTLDSVVVARAARERAEGGLLAAKGGDGDVREVHGWGPFGRG